MQLTVREVGQFVSVPDATVTRWVEQRGLPAHPVAGRYRFNRAEVLEWATANQVRVSAELFDVQGAPGDWVVNPMSSLEAGAIVWILNAADKPSALQALVEALPLPGAIIVVCCYGSSWPARR